VNDAKQFTDDLAILEQLNDDYVHSDQYLPAERDVTGCITDWGMGMVMTPEFSDVVD
jgi:hypothetical protein